MNTSPKSGRTATAAHRHCPNWPTVPVVVIMLILAIAITIGVSLTMILGGHPANLASGIIWA